MCLCSLLRSLRALSFVEINVKKTPPGQGRATCVWAQLWRLWGVTVSVVSVVCAVHWREARPEALATICSEREPWGAGRAWASSGAEQRAAASLVPPPELSR
jgi:hypothetical protein